MNQTKRAKSIYTEGFLSPPRKTVSLSLAQPGNNKRLATCHRRNVPAPSLAQTLPASLLWGVAPGKKLVGMVGIGMLLDKGSVTRSAAIVGAAQPALETRCFSMYIPHRYVQGNSKGEITEQERAYGVATAVMVDAAYDE